MHNRCIYCVYIIFPLKFFFDGSNRDSFDVENWFIDDNNIKIVDVEIFDLKISN